MLTCGGTQQPVLASDTVYHLCQHLRARPHKNQNLFCFLKIIMAPGTPMAGNPRSLRRGVIRRGCGSEFPKPSSILTLWLVALCPPQFHGYVACPVDIWILLMIRHRVNTQLLSQDTGVISMIWEGIEILGIKSINCLACCLPLWGGGQKLHPKMQAPPKQKTLQISLM